MELLLPGKIELLGECDLHIISLKNFHNSWVLEVTKLPQETGNTGCLWGVEPLVAKGERELFCSFPVCPLYMKAIWGQGWSNFFTQDYRAGNSLAVQWLGLCALTAEGPGSVPSWGTKIPQAAWHCQKNPPKTKKTKDYRAEVGTWKRDIKIRREKSCSWVENHDQKGNSRTAHQSGQKQLLEGVVQNQKTKPRETEEQEQTGE